jgi:CheY-like chemotaxis protein
MNTDSAAAKFTADTEDHGEKEPERHSLSILIVEDNEVTQDLLKFFLTQYGYKVSAVSNGETALQELFWQHFDIALMDFHLPAKDGLEIVLEYKTARPSGRTPKFIGMTADVEGLLAHPFNCENFDKIFCKPVNPNELCRGIEQFWSASPVDEQDPKPLILNPRAASLTAKRMVDTNWTPLSRPGSPIVGADAAEPDKPASDPELRTWRRTAMSHASTTLMLGDGSLHPCEVTDISIGGLGVVVGIRPKIGERVTIGKSPAWVVRHTCDGVALSLLLGSFTRPDPGTVRSKASQTPYPGGVSLAWLRRIGK